MDAMASSIAFARAARSLGDCARALGLEVPAFRSPPRHPDVVRSIRRTPRGCTVSVVIAGRPWSNVLADLIDGIVVANELAGPEAVRTRTMLWASLEHDDSVAA